MKYLEAIGKYFIMIWEVFKKPTKWRIMKTLIFKEIDELIYGAMGIIIFISFFDLRLAKITEINHQIQLLLQQYRIRRLTMDIIAKNSATL